MTRVLPIHGRPVAARLAGTRDLAARLFETRGRRERIAITLVLGEGLRPIEAAVALGVSVRQVNRTVAAFLAELERVAASRPVRARRAPATALRSAA